MPSKTRVPNKVQWGLDAIQDDVAQAESAWLTIYARLQERFQDPAALMALSDLRHHLSNIRTRASDARHGEFNERL